MPKCTDESNCDYDDNKDGDNDDNNDKLVILSSIYNMKTRI